MKYRLHHIGLLVANLEATSDLLVNCMGFIRESPFILDEVQTARVCFLRQPGQPHWLELVTPHGGSSKLASALRRGVGPHHMAFEVEDVILAAKDLRCKGYMPLGHPKPGAAYAGRRILWLFGENSGLTELVESGDGPLILPIGSLE